MYVSYLVVDGFIEVLDEDVTDTGPAERRVTLGPHDAARLVLDSREVHRVQSALGCARDTNSTDRQTDRQAVFVTFTLSSYKGNIIYEKDVLAVSYSSFPRKKN